MSCLHTVRIQHMPPSSSSCCVTVQIGLTTSAVVELSRSSLCAVGCLQMAVCTSTIPVVSKCVGKYQPVVMPIYFNDIRCHCVFLKGCPYAAFAGGETISWWARRTARSSKWWSTTATNPSSSCRVTARGNYGPWLSTPLSLLQ